MKNKLLLMLICIAISPTIWGQIKNGIKPAPNASALLTKPSVADMSGPKTLSCTDTIRYPQVKEQVIGSSNFYSFELWQSDAEAISQTFLLSGSTLSISKVEFFGRKAPASSPNVQVTATIYNVDGSNNPTTSLGSGTITFNDTNWTYRTITFSSAINVSNNYAVVIHPSSSSGIVEVYLNNAIPAQSYDENLSRAKSNYYPGSGGNWVSIPTLTATFPGGPYDFEALVAPIITYSINTNFTTSPTTACSGTLFNFTNTTTPTSVLTSRMYNFNRFISHFFSAPDSTYVWDSDDPAPLSWTQNFAHTYTAPGTYNTTLYTLGGFWTSCLDNKVNPTVVLGTPANSSPIAGNASICAGSSQTYSVTNDPNVTTYTWNLPSGWSGSSTTNSINVTAGSTGGTISVTPSNACGTASTTVMNITVNQDNANFAYATNTVCLGSPNTTPTIYTSGTFSSTPAGLVFANTSTGEINMSSSSPGTYNVTFTTSGPCTNSSTQVINITNSPDATFSYTSNPYCQNASNPLPTFPPGASAGTFSSNPAGMAFVNSSTGEINIAISLPGTYSITNTIPASGACPMVSFINSVTINPLPTPSIIGTSNICIGNSTTLTGTDGIAYNWSTGQTSNPIVVNPTSNTVYTVTATNTFGCTASTSQLVTVNSLPSPSITGTTTICEGESTTITGNDGVSYSWNTGATTSGITVNPMVNTAYTVTATNAVGCTASASQMITVNSLPTVTLSAFPFAFVCVYDANLTLTDGTPSGGTFSGPGVSGNTFNPSTAGVGSHTIQYAVTDGNNCTGSDSETLVVDACLSIDENWETSLVMAPNPASDKLFISFNTGINGDVFIRLFSLDGKAVYTSYAGNSGAYQGYIDVSVLADGVYMLQVESKAGIISRKLIKH